MKRKDNILFIDFNKQDISYQIMEIYRTNSSFSNFQELKEVISELLECKYVDGKNLINKGKYLAGIYIDDMELISQKKKAIVINEREGLSVDDCLYIALYLQKTEFLKKELIDRYEL